MNKAQISDLYTRGEYLRHNPSWHQEDSPWKAKQILKVIRSSRLKCRSIAEVGCGAGEILAELRRELAASVSLTGFDISPDAIALCKPKERAGLKFQLKDFSSTPSERYDLLLAIDVVEHVPDYLGFLKALRPRAKYHLFHIPLDLSASSILREHPLVEGRGRIGHINYFTSGIALAALAESGFEVMDASYTCASLDLPAPQLKTRLARVPRMLGMWTSPSFAARLVGGYSLLALARPTQDVP